MDSDREPDDTAPDPRHVLDDPAAFREAHAKYGTYLKQGGLPFEPEELDDEEEPRASETVVDEDDQEIEVVEDDATPDPSAD